MSECCKKCLYAEKITKVETTKHIAAVPRHGDMGIIYCSLTDELNGVGSVCNNYKPIPDSVTDTGQAIVTLSNGKAWVTTPANISARSEPEPTLTDIMAEIKAVREDIRRIREGERGMKITVNGRELTISFWEGKESVDIFMMEKGKYLLGNECVDVMKQIADRLKEPETTTVKKGTEEEWFDEVYKCVKCEERFMTTRFAPDFCPNCGRKIEGSDKA